MKKVYSKIYPKKLLHVFVKPSDFKNNITELTGHSSFLQCLGLKLFKGKKFNAHKHKKIKRPSFTSITQESWCVIRGSAKVFFYDFDGTLLHTEKFKAGYASFTFEGGHSYEILSDNTLIYEYKNGPYLGVDDKYYFK
jgi:hypothetical protein